MTNGALSDVKNEYTIENSSGPKPLRPKAQEVSQGRARQDPSLSLGQAPDTGQRSLSDACNRNRVKLTLR